MYKKKSKDNFTNDIIKTKRKNIKLKTAGKTISCFLSKY